MRPTKVPELGVVLHVGDDFDGEVALEFEPLASLAELVEGDLGEQGGVVAAAAVGGGVVEGGDEAGVGVGDVVVEEGEVEEGDARLREQDEAVVGVVEERVG